MRSTGGSMRVHADPSVITPPPGGPKRAPGSEQHLLAPQQHASSITVHVEPSPSAPRQKLHGSSQWGANGGTPDTRLADNDERKSDGGVGHAAAANGGSSARVVPAGGIATTNPPRRNGNSRLRASADIGSDRSLGSDSHPRPPLSESKAAPHVQIPTVAASVRGSHAGSVTSRSTAGTRRRRKRHSGSTAAPSMSVRVTEMALEPLSVARMSCDMAPLDYLPSLRVLLRAVGSDSHDVEAVYVGDSTDNSHSRHLQLYYGHDSRVVSVDHIGTSAVVSASNTSVFCHELKSGEVRWSFFMTAVSFATVFSQRMVLVGGVKLGRYAAFVQHRRTELIALDVQTGAVLWDTALKAGALVLKLCPSARLALLGMESGALEAHDLMSGTLLWSAKVCLSKSPSNVTALAVDDSENRVYSAARTPARVVCINVSNRGRPTQEWATSVSTAHKLDASDFIARIFVAGRSKPVEGSDLDTVVAVTAHGVGFRLRVSDGAVVAFQHSYSIPRLCDMRRGDSGFTALNAGEMTLGQWEVSSMDNPPLWCVRLDPLMHTDIRCVRHFKTGSGTVVLVSSAGGQTLMLSAVDGGILSFVPVLHLRDALLFVLPVLPPWITGCDCGCGASEVGETAHAYPSFGSKSSASRGVLSTATVRREMLLQEVGSGHLAKAREADAEARRAPVVTVSEAGRIVLRRRQDPRSGPGYRAVRAPADITCARVHLGEAPLAKAGKDGEQAMSAERPVTVFTGHFNAVMRWDMAHPPSHGVASAPIDKPAWEAPTTGTVIGVDVCEVEGVVVAVVSHEVDDELNEEVQEAVAEVASAAAVNRQAKLSPGHAVDASLLPADRVNAYSVATGELVWTTRTLTDKMHADGADDGASIVSDDGGDGPQPTLGHLQKITAACVCSAAGATVVGYACGWLLCMNTKTGVTKWTKRVFAGAVKCVAQASAYGLILAADSEGIIQAFDSATGEVRWKGGAKTKTPVLSLGLAQAASIVVSLTMDNATRGWSLKDGALIWVHEQDVASDPVQELVVTPSVAIIRSLHTISACDAETGQQQWVYDPPFGEIRAMAPNHGSAAPASRLFVASGSGRVEELNVTARTQWWEVEETRTVVSSEAEPFLDMVLDSYGSRLAFVWNVLVLVVEILQLVALPYAFSLDRTTSSLRWLQDNLLWPVATLSLGDDAVGWEPAFIAACVIATVLLLLSVLLPRLETRVFVSGQSSCSHVLWLLASVLLQLVNRLAVIAVVVGLSRVFQCRSVAGGDLILTDADSASLECFSDAEHWVVFAVAVVLLCSFTVAAVVTANAPGRWDLPDTSHRYTRMRTIRTRLGPRDQGHALAVASTPYAVCLVLGKVLLAAVAVVFASATRAGDKYAQLAASWAMAVVWVLVVVATALLRPFSSWRMQAGSVAVNAGIGWVFVAAGVWRVCLVTRLDGVDDSDSICESGFGSPVTFAWAALVFGAVLAFQVIDVPKCAPTDDAASLVYVSSGGKPARRRVKRRSHYSGGNTTVTDRQRVKRMMRGDDVDHSDAWRDPDHHRARGANRHDQR